MNEVIAVSCIRAEKKVLIADRYRQHTAPKRNLISALSGGGAERQFGRCAPLCC